MTMRWLLIASALVLLAGFSPAGAVATDATLRSELNELVKTAYIHGQPYQMQTTLRILRARVTVDQASSVSGRLGKAVAPRGSRRGHRLPGGPPRRP